LSSHGQIDVVIVGGGPAGTTTAIALAKAAPSASIALLEKAHFPRDKYCAGGLGGRGEKILLSLQAMPDVPSVPLTGISFRAQPGERAENLGTIGRVVRRKEFDHALVQIARQRGVRVVEGAQVESLQDATVVTSASEFHARVVVGADGVGSVVRRAMGLGHGLWRAQVLEVDTEPVAEDRDRATIHFDLSDRTLNGYFWDFPTRFDDADLMCRGIYHVKMDDTPVDLSARLGERLTTMGLDLARYKNKRFSERGFEADLRLATSRWMLVGEAAGIDPLTGEGIAQAIEYGAMAGPFIARVLTGDASLKSWTDEVRRSRLGRDLRVRTRMLREIFGPHRDQAERFLLSGNGAPLRTGIRHFAAEPHPPADLALSALRAGVHFLRSAAG
jgi:flavin-dependent dehydrogenase